MLSLGELYASVSTEEENKEQDPNQVCPPQGAGHVGTGWGRAVARSAGLPEPPEEEEEECQECRADPAPSCCWGQGASEPLPRLPTLSWERDGWCECSWGLREIKHGNVGTEPNPKCLREPRQQK